MNNQPHISDFVFTFESPGLTPFFQELVCVNYMPEESVLTSKDNLTQSFVSKRGMKAMERAGEIFYSNVEQIQKTMEEIRKILPELSRAFDACDPGPLTLSQVEQIYSLMQRANKEYSYLGHGFTDTVYIQATDDSNKKEALAYLEAHKNPIREVYTDVFFNPVAGSQKYIQAIARQFNISPQDIEYYLKAEVLQLFNGVRVPPESIAARKLSFVFWKPDASYVFLEGEEALAFIEGFGSIVPKSAVTELKGKVANKGQGIARGHVCLIESDYTDPAGVAAKMDAMQKGDILVASSTAPDLMPACRKAAAIVTDVGGILSHGAIISRELGIPGIVDTQFASKVLKNGDMVEVDTEKGIVRKI